MVDWHVYEALAATIAAAGAASDGPLHPGAGRGRGSDQADSLRAVIALLVLIWNDELEQALRSATRCSPTQGPGSMNMVANVRCLRSMILRRLGRRGRPRPTAGRGSTSS